MKRFIDFWKNIRYSLWLIPAVIVLIAVGLAIAAIDIDTRVSEQVLSRWPRMFGASSEGARGILQVIAGAMMTVAAMTFSITVVVLSLGASQYTPRIIRTFMGNRPTQMVLGVFVGVFVYCLIVLRSIRGGSDAFNPSISVAIAILLAFVGVGFLVYFIHHIASSIQASAIVSSVADDTVRAIETIYPDRLADHHENDEQRDREEMGRHQWYPVVSAGSGYVQTVDLNALSAFADEHKLIVRMEKPVGAFVAAGSIIASATVTPDEKMARKLNQAYTISHYRTLELDAGSGIRQLVDIALKAMSPAMNDTTTAIMCIDFLSVILIRLTPRCIVPDRCLRNGALKVFTRGAGFEDFLREAFEQIRECAQENVAIYIRLLHAYELLAHAATTSDRKANIEKQVQLVMAFARHHLRIADQIERVEKVQLQTLKALQG